MLHNHNHNEITSRYCPIMVTTATMQERLAPSAVTHRTSTLHPYNTRQQTGLASQQLNKCQIMPAKCTPTETILTVRKLSICRADPSTLNKKGGKGGDTYVIKYREERGRGAQKERAAQNRAGCRVESRRRT